MHGHKTAFIFVSTILMLAAVTVSAQEGVQNLAVIANALGPDTSLTIVDLDEPDVKKAVEKKILPLGDNPSDIGIHRGLAYVVNTFSHNIQIIDLWKRTEIGEIPIGDGTQPQQIAFINRTKAYVTCDGVDEIRVIDISARRVTNTIPGGLKPTGITVFNGKAYVTNPAFVLEPFGYEDSSVTVIDTRTDTVLKTIPMPINATGITNDGESKVLVLSAGNLGLVAGEPLVQGNLVIIDANTDEVEKTVRLRTTPGFSIVVNSRKHVFMNDGFLTNRGVMVYDFANEEWIHDRNDAIAEFAGGAGLAVDQNDNVYVMFPDWTGGNFDQMRVLAPDETLLKTYEVGGGGASIIAVAQIQPIEIVAADVNADDMVNIADLILVASHFGETGAQNPGDVNGDGIVDVLDLVRVAVHISGSIVAAPSSFTAYPLLSDNRQGATEQIRRAIAALELFPDQSPTVRLIKDFLNTYITNRTSAIAKTELFANYPNPFNPETWIPFQLAAGSSVVIRIYDPFGRPVRDIDLGHRNAGQYATQSRAAFWDGKNGVGEHVTSGVYFYQLRTDHFTATRKMVVLK